ncbi:MAG: RNA polymerase sigma factor, partial [Myxococcota bacterium]
MNRPPRSTAIEALLDATLSSSKSDGYIERLKARDDAALTRLYEDHVTYIDRLLYRVLGPDPNHQDLVQDVFINAIESLIRFRGNESSLRPWLAKIAVHRARRELRYRKVRRFIGLSPAGELPDLPATDNPELQAQLQRAFEIIDRLGTDDQLVFS